MLNPAPAVPDSARLRHAQAPQHCPCAHASPVAVAAVISERFDGGSEERDPSAQYGRRLPADWFRGGWNAVCAHLNGWAREASFAFRMLGASAAA